MLKRRKMSDLAPHDQSLVQANRFIENEMLTSDCFELIEYYVNLFGRCLAHSYVQFARTRKTSRETSKNVRGLKK